MTWYSDNGEPDGTSVTSHPPADLIVGEVTTLSRQKFTLMSGCFL